MDVTRPSPRGWGLGMRLMASVQAIPMPCNHKHTYYPQELGMTPQRGQNKYMNGLLWYKDVVFFYLSVHVYVVGSGPVHSRSRTVHVFIVGSEPIHSRSHTVHVY